MSSEADAVGSSSEPKDGSAGQANVMPTAVELGAVVSLSGTHENAEAMLDRFMDNFKPPEEFTWQMNVDRGSFVFSVQWNVEETADAATSTHEPGRRCS